MSREARVAASAAENPHEEVVSVEDRLHDPIIPTQRDAAPRQKPGAAGISGPGAIADPGQLRRPEWLKIRLNDGANVTDVRRLMRGLTLNTVCEEARCPNLNECWHHRTATFMILGSICTRACGFCAVTTGRPTELDLEEPLRVAEAVQQLGLRHVVVTSVARDDLQDGGASIFAETIRQVRRLSPGTSIEVLIPDFGGDAASLKLVMDARPNILNHNLETVARLSDSVRSKAKYPRSLEVLRRAKEMDGTIYTKSGMMLGLGEEWDEVVQTLRDLRGVGVDIVTIGQYLRPTLRHLPIVRYVPPQEFARLKDVGLEMGFAHVESGPLVRSSYHAHEQVQGAQAAENGTGAAAAGVNGAATLA